MHRAAKTSRFLIDLSSEQESADLERAVSSSRLLQHIVMREFARAADSRHLFSELAKRLVELAEHAYSLRDATTLEETSQLLLSLPTPFARQTGRYYRALAIRQNGRINEALSMLERVADEAPLFYRARAVQALGAIHHRQGLHAESLRFYPEALRMASPAIGGDLLTTLLVHFEISCIESEMGDHRSALAGLEALSPIVRVVSPENPLYFYLYHNELAIELGEIGRLAEAAAASAIALASPFAHAYPEWTATRDEIAVKRKSANRSVVATNRPIEASASRQAYAERKPKRASSLAFKSPERGLASKGCFQRSRIPIAPSRAITQAGITDSILERLLCHIAPRAPPALS